VSVENRPGPIRCAGAIEERGAHLYENQGEKGVAKAQWTGKPSGEKRGGGLVWNFGGVSPGREVRYLAEG